VAHFLLLFGFVWWIYRQLILDLSNADLDKFDWRRSSNRGWKILHGDVFRPPQRASSLVALNPHGAFVILLIVFFSVSPVGRTCNTAVLVYFVTAVSGGAAAVSFGNSFGIQTWLWLAWGAFLGVDKFVGISAQFWAQRFST
jgi:hypothetical protein